MPNSNLSQTSSDKSSVRPSESSKLGDRVEQAASHASSAAADKARQVRDQVQDAAASAQTKASSLAEDTRAAAAKLGPEIADTARSVVASAKDAVDQVKEGSSALLHDARDAAVESYQSARDYALDAAHEVNDRAREAGQQTLSYARRASLATGRFATVHALPLTLVGASLGWLAWSIRQESRRQFRVESPRPTRLQTTIESRRSAMRGRELPEGRPNAATATTSGAKLMGVRATEPAYDDLWTPADRPLGR